MRRREVIAGLAALSSGAVASPVCAQQALRIYRIGIIETVAPAHNKANLAALVGALRELGYVEGANLHIEYRSADGEAARFPEIAAELVTAGVDLIVTRGTPAALAAKNATQSIPIVMAAIGEPIGPGVVAQLARPGGNITGLSAFVTELQGKRVQLIKEAVPGTTCVSALLNMGNPVSPPQWQETMRVTQALGLKARLVDVRRPDDLAAGIDSAVKDGADALAAGCRPSTRRANSRTTAACWPTA
jgi:putative tryptophan/tyrosine transport system substrate-binding protein